MLNKPNFMKYTIMIFIIFTQNFLLSQRSMSFDSLMVFNNNSMYLDSIIWNKLKETTLNEGVMFSLLEKKIESGHFVSDNAIDFSIHWIATPAVRYNDKCDSIRLSLISKLVDAAVFDISKIQLLKIQKKYLEDNRCYTKNIYKKIKDINIQLIKLEYNIKLNADISLLNNYNDLGEYYLSKKDYINAEKSFLYVLSNNFYKMAENEGFDSAKSSYEKEYIKAAIKILELRKTSLEKLNYTFFMPNFYDTLEPIKKIYIEKLGGKYLHPTILKNKND
jgi:hypothetical protein